MAESKNHFFKAKMNKDIEPRMLPNKEYYDALNININKTGADGGMAGALENTLGNVLAYSDTLGYSDCDCIGYYVSEKDNRIYWAITNFTKSLEQPRALYGDKCAILYFDKNTGVATELIKGHFLNFSRSNLVFFSVISDILFFTDNFNFPRKININYAANNTNNINTESRISVVRYSPFLPINLLPNGESGMTKDSSITSNYAKEAFIKLSYRFKFIDNEYSTIAPFSQTIFQPEEIISDIKYYKKLYSSAMNDSMVNQVNSFRFNIKLPSKNVNKDFMICGVEILLKKSDETLIRAVEYVDLSNHTENYLEYTYKSEIPYKVLPEEQLNRVFDNIPRTAVANTSAGNRIIYGNYKINYNLPILNYSVNYGSKNETIVKEYRNHSVKQNRLYKVGFVLSDIQGRKSTVILSKRSSDSSIFVGPEPATEVSGGNSWKGLNLTVDIKDQISNPYATRYECICHESSWAVVGNTITIDTILDNTDYFSNGDINIPTVGSYMLGDSLEYVEILNVEFINGKTIITLSDNVSTTYGGNHTNFYVFTINKDGWYSYEIVVKQKQHEFYNVYTPGVVTLANNKTWITLNGDNINKVPRDLSQTQPKDNAYRSSVILFPKLLTLGNSTSSPAQHGPHQVSGYTIAISEINITSIANALDQGLRSSATDVYDVMYESDKNHLVAEISDPFIAYGMSIPSGSYNTALTEEPDSGALGNAKLQLSVFETKPYESDLDLFWETSSCGLVEEINWAILKEQATEENPTTLYDIKSVNYNETEDCIDFREDLVEGSIIDTLKGVGGSGNYTYQKISITDDLGNNVNTVADVDATGKIVLMNRYVYISSSVANLSSQSFHLKVMVTDNNTNYSITKTILVKLKNQYPYSLSNTPAFDMGNIINLASNVSSQSNAWLRVLGYNGTSKNPRTEKIKNVISTDSSNLLRIYRFPAEIPAPAIPEYTLTPNNNVNFISTITLQSLPANEVKLLRIESTVTDGGGNIGYLKEPDYFCATSFVRVVNSLNDFRPYNLFTIEKPQLIRESDNYKPNVGDFYTDTTYTDSSNLTILTAGSQVADYGLGYGENTKAHYTNYCQSFRWYIKQDSLTLEEVFLNPSVPIGIDPGTVVGTLVTSVPLYGNTTSTRNTVVGSLTASAGNTLRDLSTPSNIFCWMGLSPGGPPFYSYKIIAEWNDTGMVKCHYVRRVSP